MRICLRVRSSVKLSFLELARLAAATMNLPFGIEPCLLTRESKWAVTKLLTACGEAADGCQSHQPFRMTFTISSTLALRAAMLTMMLILWRKVRGT